MIVALELDDALVNWGRNLPEQLQIHSPLSHHNTIFRRLAIVGKVRLLHARILLFRPILSQFCLPQSHPASSPAGLQDSLTHRTVIQCSNLCLGAAHDIIELIYTNLDLTAATVLLAERIRPVIAVGITTYSNALSWTRAIEILSAYARIASQNPPDDASPHSRSCLPRYPGISNREASWRLMLPSTTHQAVPPNPPFTRYQAQGTRTSVPFTSTWTICSGLRLCRGICR